MAIYNEAIGISTYNSYESAKIANPDCEIVTTASEWTGGCDFTGKFQALDKHNNEEGYATHIVDGKHGWAKCNPADHCMTVEKFLADGYRFVKGDVVFDFGDVVSIGTVFDVETYNKTDKMDDLRYILRAAALEEKEPELTKDDSPRGILSAISNRLHNVGCEHQNLAFGHELSGMACDIWGVLPLISNEPIQERKPRTKVEYVKVDKTTSVFTLSDDYHNDKLVGSDKNPIQSEIHLMEILTSDLLYRRIETQMTEREAFVEALNDLFQSHTMSTSDLFNAIVDSGRFKLVN